MDVFVGHVSGDDLDESDGGEMEDLLLGGEVGSGAALSGQERGWKRKVVSTEGGGSRAAKYRRV